MPDRLLAASSRTSERSSAHASLAATRSASTATPPSVALRRNTSCCASVSALARARQFAADATVAARPAAAARRASSGRLMCFRSEAARAATSLKSSSGAAPTSGSHRNADTKTGATGTTCPQRLAVRMAKSTTSMRCSVRRCSSLRPSAEPSSALPPEGAPPPCFVDASALMRAPLLSAPACVPMAAISSAHPSISATRPRRVASHSVASSEQLVSSAPPDGSSSSTEQRSRARQRPASSRAACAPGALRKPRNSSSTARLKPRARVGRAPTSASAAAIRPRRRACAAAAAPFGSGVSNTSRRTASAADAAPLPSPSPPSEPPPPPCQTSAYLTHCFHSLAAAAPPTPRRAASRAAAPSVCTKRRAASASAPPSESTRVTSSAESKSPAAIVATAAFVPGSMSDLARCSASGAAKPIRQRGPAALAMSWKSPAVASAKSERVVTTAPAGTLHDDSNLFWFEDTWARAMSSSPSVNADSFPPPVRACATLAVSSSTTDCTRARASAPFDARSASRTIAAAAAAASFASAMSPAPFAMSDPRCKEIASPAAAMWRSCGTSLEAKFINDSDASARASAAVYPADARAARNMCASCAYRQCSACFCSAAVAAFVPAPPGPMSELARCAHMEDDQSPRSHASVTPLRSARRAA
mmetsp:Transcript_12628/g.53112  ORF Transcript_12628/g.53112 Transcript_12628/m.53112 type:complete len:649 (+) Transcript_12628:529-2475(+)